MRCRGLIALLIWGQSVAAADLGTWGDLWPVKEPDMLTVIMQRLTALEQSGEMGRKMDAFKERVIRNSLRPPAVPGIGRTEKYGSRLFDPSVRLAADIRDNEGRVFTLLLSAAAVQASTRDEIERLWNPQGMATQPAQPAAGTSARTAKPAPRWFRLSNGRQVNLADWKVVLFMQGHCPYCHQFDPVLKQLAQQYGFSVFPYTLDGQGDTAFPEALPVPPDVMQTFFPNIPVATPTTFLVNVNTLEALPLLQGATDAAGFMARMDTVLQMYGGKKGAK